MFISENRKQQAILNACHHILIILHNYVMQYNGWRKISWPTKEGINREIHKGIDKREEGEGRKLEPGEDDANETASRRLGACFPTTDLRDFPTTRDNLCPSDEWQRVATRVHAPFFLL